MDIGIAESLRKQRGPQNLADIGFFWGLILAWPIGLVLLGVLRLLDKGFAMRRVGYILVGLLVLTLDVAGSTFGENRWWLTAFVPHASVLVAVALFSIGTIRLNLMFRFRVWCLNWRKRKRGMHK